MVKRILAAVLALLLLPVVLTSCGNRGGADVHVFYYTFSDTYVSSVRSALGRELSRSGLSYQDYDANGNQTTQTE